MRFSRESLTGLVVVTALAVGCARHQAGPNPSPARPDPVAPDSFRVSFETSRGAVEVLLHRTWSPRGVDRFYYLVKHRFFNSARFFRVVPHFVAQFGLPADPHLAEKLNTASIPDEPVRHGNLRGTLSYARGGPNSRDIQLYINLQDNGRLDTLNGFGFPPIGEIVHGIELIDLFNGEYDGDEGPDQDSIRVEGNQYLTRTYPRLDFIRTITILREWK